MAGMTSNVLGLGDGPILAIGSLPDDIDIRLDGVCVECVGCIGTGDFGDLASLIADVSGDW